MAVTRREQPAGGPGPSRRRGPGPACWLGGMVLLALGAAVLAQAVELNVLLWYLGASTVAFAAYALDKSAARKGARRTRESTLHLLALAGGWPGAALASWLVRHKTIKTSFRIVFWLSLLGNLAGLAVFLFPAWAETLWLDLRLLARPLFDHQV